MTPYVIKLFPTCSEVARLHPGDGRISVSTRMDGKTPFHTNVGTGSRAASACASQVLHILAKRLS